MSIILNFKFKLELSNKILLSDLHLQLNYYYVKENSLSLSFWKKDEDLVFQISNLNSTKDLLSLNWDLATAAFSFWLFLNTGAEGDWLLEEHVFLFLKPFDPQGPL